MTVRTADWFRTQEPTSPPACICVWQRTGHTTYALRLRHWRCPQHGHWKAVA